MRIGLYLSVLFALIAFSCTNTGISQEELYEEIVKSKSFIALYEAFENKPNILSRTTLSDGFEHLSKDEQLARVNEMNRITKEQIEITKETAEFIDDAGILEINKSSFEKISSFIGASNYETSVKNDLIEFYQYELDGEYDRLMNELIGKFQSLKTETDVVNIIFEYKKSLRHER